MGGKVAAAGLPPLPPLLTISSSASAPSTDPTTRPIHPAPARRLSRTPNSNLGINQSHGHNYGAEVDDEMFHPDLDIANGGGRGGKKRKIPGFEQTAWEMSMRMSDSAGKSADGQDDEHGNGHAIAQTSAGSQADAKLNGDPSSATTVNPSNSTAVTSGSDNTATGSDKGSAPAEAGTGADLKESSAPAAEANAKTGTVFVRQNLKALKASYLREYRKRLFLRRKAAFITLYLDAHNIINNTLPAPASATAAKTSATGSNSNHNSTSGSSVQPNKAKPSAMNGIGKLPDVIEFEKLLPVLNDMGVECWSPDRPGWRDGDDKMQPVRWRRTKRTRAAHRKPVERKGWMPEGSFEFEMECEASRALRAKMKQKTALLRLADELRDLILAANKSTITTTTTTTMTTTTTPGPTPASPPPSENQLQTHAEAQAQAQSQPMSQAPSKDSTETSKGKKKPKKKKRSVLANQSNPHHVNNYRPSRTVSPHSDPYEPYSHHLSLFSPPSMAFLAARPRSSARPEQPFVVRPAEDDYICSFCEYDLYYGSEKSRRLAIRRRRREIKRKETIKNKARNVAEGRGKLNDEDDDGDYVSGEEDDEYDEDDEDGDAFADQACQDDGHGRCT
ncbi:hypothetical protein I316_06763 [Kwoniella heveanensis BCC8398]|uniref:Uncharacterized protein n=1 Tax=Kwoniella heveanensis BCC8398 TaxID=1296120 RepID=A0A1B9GKH4_9TREE|nr:hypothetical protein I316_06763 [Kwoniella heveanensis BCC8398]